MTEHAIDNAEDQLRRADKRARKMLRAARKGGRGAGGLAQAGADVQWAVIQQRAMIAKDARLSAVLSDAVHGIVAVVTQAYERKVAPPAPVPSGAGSPPMDVPRMPRDMEIYYEVKRLSAERAQAEPKIRAALELQINELRDEFLDLRRTQAAPLLANYSCEVHKAAAERLAAVLLELELNDSPNQALETKRDRLGELLQRLAEQRGMSELKTAMGPGAAD